jgi:5-methylcytosine-specific restriction protein A
MPDLLKKRCGVRGCPNTTRHRYCDEHAPLARRFYDRRRGSSTQRGYDSDWERVAEHRRQLDGGLCQACLEDDLVTASQIVDHIIPLHVRPDWRLEIGNTQVLCHPCHTRKSSDDLKRYGGRARTQLTPEQRRNRIAAMHMQHPPRDGEAGNC